MAFLPDEDRAKLSQEVVTQALVKVSLPFVLAFVLVPHLVNAERKPGKLKIPRIHVSFESPRPLFEVLSSVKVMYCSLICSYHCLRFSGFSDSRC